MQDNNSQKGETTEQQKHNDGSSDEVEENRRQLTKGDQCFYLHIDHLDDFVLEKILLLCDAPMMPVLLFVCWKWKCLVQEYINKHRPLLIHPLADHHACTCEYAARCGQLELLQWARKHGLPWDASTCSAAAEFGNLDILKWARASRCAWDHNVGVLAAATDNFELLKWARENMCPWSEGICKHAASSSSLEVRKWIRYNGCPCSHLERLRNLEL